LQRLTQQPKVFGLKISLREIKRILKLKYTISSFGKRLNKLSFRLPAGGYFLNCDNPELKTSSKIVFFSPNGSAGQLWVHTLNDLAAIGSLLFEPTSVVVSTN